MKYYLFIGLMLLAHVPPVLSQDAAGDGLPIMKEPRDQPVQAPHSKSELKDLLNQKRSEIRELSKELDELRRGIIESDEELGLLQSEIDFLQKQLREKQSSLDEKLQERDQFRELEDELQNRIKELKVFRQDYKDLVKETTK